jgi:hypothetical protein
MNRIICVELMICVRIIFMGLIFVNMNVKAHVLNHHGMMMHAKVEVEVHTFLSLTVDGG